MKSGNIYRTILLLAFVTFTAATGYAQSIIQGDPSMEIREQANEEVEMWKDQLSLTSKQEDLMEKKIIEFAMKREELLQSKMQEEAKTERLKLLQISEHKDMRDILTKPQFERYLAIQEARAGTEEEEQNEGRS